MTDSSSSTAPSSIVRKFTDSVVIGSHEQQMPDPVVPQAVHNDPQAQAQQQAQQQQAQQQQSSKKKPRIVSCHFEMEIPTNALRMEMSIIVSTNDTNRMCSYDEMTGTHTNLLPRPSVTYKITICTPRRQEAAAAVAHEEQDTTTTTKTATTFKYSSKFTIAKDIDDNVVPYHEWNGSFALGAKQNTPLPLEECSFHQVQGIFTANYDHDTDTDTDDDTNNKEQEDTIHRQEEDQTTTTTASVLCSSRKRKKKNFNDREKEDYDNDDDDTLVPPRKKQRQEETKLNLRQQQQQQRQQHLVVT
mmetsp:Transcript_49055/g.55599  ORF Transcript_49055/g.55599 Transcript_49055/m.55599 type:complete len:302 (-) Transcript_49055:98-1003(-)